MSTAVTETKPQIADIGITSSDEDDTSILLRADEDIKEERLLVAARLLRKVKDQSKLTALHKWVLHKAERAETVVTEGIAKPGPEWKLQGESHDGKYDTMIYYKIDNNAHLTARIETPIEKSLLVPLLSVFNETHLYTTFFPRFERPIKVGVDRCDQLRQQGRCNQLIIATTDLPWPIAKRECLIDVVAIDAIDANGAIVVRMETGSPDDPDAPPVEKGAVRIDFEGGILFRKCPKDHICLENSKKVHDSTDEPKEDMILVCMTMLIDPKMKFVPHALVNFITRTVLGSMWHTALEVAEDVRDGKRPEHAKAIEEKRELVYDWVDQRAQVMLSSM